MNQVKCTLLSAALALFALPVVAQSTNVAAQGTATPPAPSGQTIQERKDNQQELIANGVKSGELTAGETTNLEGKETKLNHEEGVMRSEDDGHLTGADRAKLNQQENKLSHQIYDDKHNGESQNASPRNEVGMREENQQNRIANGVKSGQLTAGEASHLEKNEARINNEVQNERAANGGKLTAAEKARVNRQQNRESHQIYRAKHNSRIR